METIEHILSEINNFEKGCPNMEYHLKGRIIRKYSNKGDIQMSIFSFFDSSTANNGYKSMLKYYTDETKFISAIKRLLK